MNFALWTYTHVVNIFSWVQQLFNVNMSTRTLRASYTVGFKLKVIEEAEKTGNRSAGRVFGVNEKLVRDWRKKKDELMKMLKAAKSARPGMKPYWPEVENKLHEWILEKRLNGIGISGTMVRLKAKMMAKEMSPSDVAGFRGSTVWLHRFMKRKSLALRAKTRISQCLPQDFEDKIVAFQRTMIQIRQRKHYDMQQIGNMDETPMNFDMPLTRTVDTSGRKSILIKTTGNEKNHCCFGLHGRWHQVATNDHFQEEDHAKGENSFWGHCSYSRKGMDGRRWYDEALDR